MMTKKCFRHKPQQLLALSPPPSARRPVFCAAALVAWSLHLLTCYHDEKSHLKSNSTNFTGYFDKCKKTNTFVSWVLDIISKQIRSELSPIYIKAVSCFCNLFQTLGLAFVVSKSVNCNVQDSAIRPCLYLARAISPLSWRPWHKRLSRFCQNDEWCWTPYINQHCCIFWHCAQANILTAW